MLPLKHHSMDKNHYSDIEEWLSVASHVLGAMFSIVGLVLLINKATTLHSSFAAWVYGLSLCAMFVSSSIYHLEKDAARRAIFRKIDHIAIYFLIAGSYTPLLLISVEGWIASAGLLVIWLVAFAGITFKLLLGHRFPKVSIITYAIMGWMALFAIYPIYLSVPFGGFVLLLAGGLCYSAGIPLYLLKSRHYSHAIWHVCVVAGAACHFFLMYLYVYAV
ncbi:PAQR family membrane homeostasis protein TrhA [Ningiella sp. W23]|uniref:PAQR family membrane homeostasis protein TrhA n=1 Tax=Ningiella sp. W23 TaxID=3023715 RepID=UPI003757CAB5